MKVRMALSKYEISQLKIATPEVRLWNGSFNRVRATVEFDGHSFELTVDVTHPLLLEYAGSEPQLVELVRLAGCRAHRIEVPAELLPLVESMRCKGEMSAETAQNTLNAFRASLGASHREMGFTPS